MKKLLSAILCIGLLLSLLPVTVFAATEISYVFADIDAPEIGEQPTYLATYGGVGWYLDAGNNNPNYYKNGVGWYDITAGKMMPIGSTFEAGHQYKVMIFFAAEEGYVFSNNIDIQINGEYADGTIFDGTLVCGEWTFDTLGEVNPFVDVKESDYYYEPVLWAVENGVTTGTSSTTFSPNDPCTRAQVVTFLHRSVGCPMPMPESPFSDVTGGEYYYDAVLWAAGSKITTGTTATTFSPDEACTRAQVVTFLWRTCGEPAPTSNSNPFTDVSASEYYYDAVLWAVEQGITTGTSATTFSPDETCIRGQIVTFLYRYMTGRESDLEVISQPKNHLMQSSQETVEFRVEVKGGTGPYTYRWTILRDNIPEEYLEETSESSTHVLSLTVSDYDFDQCHYFLVNCDIEDAKGARVQSEYACVYPYFAIKSSPQDYQMRSSGETAGFTVEVTGDTGPYTYQWVVCYDGEKVMLTPVTSAFPSNTLAYYFSDYDFEDYETIRVRCMITNSYGVKITGGYALVLPKE